jgi:hypothetical protein
MCCPPCESTVTRERQERTELGYRRFRCRTCKREFNERTSTRFNHLQYLTDIVCLVVLWRVRYKLSLRNLPEMFLERGLNRTTRDWYTQAARCELTSDEVAASRRAWTAAVTSGV